MALDFADLCAKEKKTYLNSSVFGGFAAYLLELAQKNNNQELEDLAIRYERSAPKDRPQLLEQIEELSALLPQWATNNEALKELNPETVSPLNTPIAYLKGIGTKRAALLKKLEINTIGDLLFFFPRAYEDRREITPIAHLAFGEVGQVRGIVLESELLRPRPHLVVISALLRDEQGSYIRAVWFNQSYLLNKLIKGVEIVVRGKVEARYRGELQIAVADFEFVTKDFKAAIVPIYRLTDKLSQKILRASIKIAWEKYGGDIPELIPSEIRQKRGLIGRGEAVYNMHFPENYEQQEEARRSLAYEELLLLQLAVQSNRYQDLTPAVCHNNKKSKEEEFFAALPFELTKAQKRAVGEIYADMVSKRVMARLLQGDVGSGKTIVAAAALHKAACGGYQGVLMAPTEILAEQHYNFLEPFLRQFGINTALLTGSVKGSTRRRVLEAVACGEVGVLVGTHALIQQGVKFHDLGLTITDEQHRFGVMQRVQLSAKGAAPDVLVMTATPIPRSLSLTLYGDLQLSVLDELPPGRKPVRTYAVGYDYEERIYKFLAKQMAAGGQVFVVCPLVEESEKLDLASASELFEKLRNLYSGYKVGLLHGRMKAAEKQAVMEAFRDGELNLLVSTTVIEVGIDIPGATVMLVRDSERFGLAQLHQLRGRVGRGSGEAFCILLHNAKGQIARERMKIMASTNDGFLLAEEDLRLRGPGEFFGVRQHGLPEFRVASLYLDSLLLNAAREDAELLLKSGSQIEALQAEMVKKFKYLN